MAQVTPKISLSVSRDIPFNKLLLSGCNVRRIKAGVSISELADDIARRTLLQSLTVRPVLDENGAETGMYEIPAGGRRYRALELLVKQKRLAKTALIPCVIRTDGVAEEDSLAEKRPGHLSGVRPQASGAHRAGAGVERERASQGDPPSAPGLDRLAAARGGRSVGGARGG
jgi:ParB-like nuclease domain